MQCENCHGEVIVGRDNDIVMLDTLLKQEDELDDWEKEAFASMRKKLEKSDKSLTSAQQEKVDAAWKRLKLDDQKCLNLWSSGKVPEGKPSDFPYNLPRPLRPPGRS